MSKRRETLLLILRLTALALVVGGLATAAAFAGEEGDVERKVIRIETHGDCEGADCEGVADVRTMVFVGEDGEVHELSGEGFHWAGESGPHVFHLGGFHGKGGFLGVLLTPMTRELRAHEGVPESAGVLVSKVIEESPAWRAGVRVGDVITAVDGEAVESPRDLAHAIRGREAGDAVTLELWRDGTLQNLAATVEEREGHALGHGRGLHRIEIRCEDGDCEGIPGEIEPYDCGGAEECEVRVECTAGECDCTVNGETADCAMLHLPHGDD